MSDVEKQSDAQVNILGATQTLHQKYIKENKDEVLLDIEAANLDGYDLSSIKVAKDGHTVLVPQPTDDPNDPLNWSWRKKHAILFVVSLTSFLADYSSAAGVPCIVMQGKEWRMSPNKVNYANSLSVAMMGVCGLLWITFVSFWGRAPVMFWSTLTGTFFTLGCALATNFDTYYAMRALMGVSLTAFQAVGLCVIKDMFFYHEHARKIGIWIASFVLSPYLGPMLGNFIIAGTGDWRAVFWLVFGTCVLDFILVVLFMDESWYNRSLTSDLQPRRGNRLLRVVGIWQVIHHENNFLSVYASFKRLFVIIFKPLMLLIFFYYMATIMWAVGINITSSVLLETPRASGGYGFSARSIGYLYFTPLVAVIVGEFFGHFFNDFLVSFYTSRHSGLFNPQFRLLMNFLASLFMIPGLVLLGQALGKHWHYGVIVIGWGLYAFGVILASVAITTYCLDKFPGHAAEVAGILNFARAAGGFGVGYFQQPWARRSGLEVSFGVQAAVVGGAMGVLGLVWWVGGRGGGEKSDGESEDAGSEGGMKVGGKTGVGDEGVRRGGDGF